MRLACHPHDPGLPAGATYRGLPRVLGSVDGLKRFVGIAESKYHGLNFCQGTVSEMLKNPRDEIADVIRYFGSRGKIFNVHFRNIRGGFLNFQETFIDDGDVDMLACLRVYRDVGYDGMIMPDHVPGIPIVDGGHIAFAYTFGYINSAIGQIVPRRSPSEVTPNRARLEPQRHGGTEPAALVVRWRPDHDKSATEGLAPATKCSGMSALVALPSPTQGQRASNVATQTCYN